MIMESSIIEGSMGKQFETMKRAHGIVIHFNDAAGIGLLLDDRSNVLFFHFTTFLDTRNRRATRGQRIWYREAAPELRHFGRQKVAVDIEVGDTISMPENVILVDGLRLDNASLENYLQTDGNNLFIFDSVTFTDEINLSNSPMTKQSILFLNCVFEDNSLFIGGSFCSSLYFTSSRFRGRFSLKNSQINGSVHLEACNFSGEGGASFRGISCDNIYLDYGVIGPEDMTWLNELNVKSSIIIGGNFPGDIQFVGNQDATSATTTSNIGRILIGSEFYKSQRVNFTYVGKTINISDTKVEEFIALQNLVGSEVVIIDSTMPELRMVGVRVDRTLAIDKSKFLSSEHCVSLLDSIIEERLVLSGNSFQGLVSLEGTTVGQLAYFKENTFGQHATLSLFNLVAGQFRFEPMRLLYLGSRFHFLQPRFSLLFRERNIANLEEEKRFDEVEKLSQEYASLRKWFVDTGHLTEEDEAFYNMRNRKERNLFKKIIYDYAFGWGVRFSNIFASGFIFIMLFGLAYSLLIGIPFAAGLVLSIEAFSSILFGDWSIYGSYHPLSPVAILYIFESVLGIVFVTGVVGAYFRKLLR